jgi:outer membrane protein assembly factor BamA
MAQATGLGLGRRHVRAVLVPLLLGLPAVPRPAAAHPVPQAAEAQEIPPQGFYGQTVTAVQFVVEGRPSTAPSLIALVDVRAGEPLTIDHVRASIYRLATRYEDVTADAAPSEGGVAVTFHLTPRHSIDELQVQGETGLPPDELRRQLLDRYGGVPATVRPELIENQATEILRDEGYLNAEVQADTVVRHDPEGATLVLSASAGARATILRSEVAGDSPLDPATIRKRTAAVPGAPYRRRAIETALADLRDELIAKGYYEAIAAHRAEPTGEGVIVTLTVEAGSIVDLIIEPQGALPGPEDELIPIRLAGSADRDLLEDSTERIEGALRADGYYRADVQVTEERPTPERLVITFRIERGPRFFVGRLDVPANLALPGSLIADRLGIETGDVFSEATYFAGVARVMDEYRMRGYYAAAAEPAVEFIEPAGGGPGGIRVVLHPEITEGPRGVVTRIGFAFEGDHELGELELRQQMRLREKQPYVDADRLRDLASLRALYEERGFLTAEVSIEPAFTSDGREVALAVTVNEGPKVVVGEITVVGNQYVPEPLIRERLALPPGTPLSPGALRDAQERLTRMGGFRRVSVTAEPGLEGETERRVIVSVTEAERLILAIGVGVEGGSTPRTAEDGGIEDRVEISPRASFEIGRRYLFNRNTSANLFTRLTLKPRSAPGDPDRDGRGLTFADYRVTGTYRELYAFGSETDLLLGLTAERSERTTFNVTRQAVNAEALHRLTPGTALIGRYSLDFAELSNERIAPEDQLLIDRIFPQVRLSILSAGLLVDRRNDPLGPSRGTYLAAEYEMALRPLGSEVGYVKGFFEARWFRNLDEGARTVLALRGQLGLARGFLRTVPRLDDHGNPVVGPDGEPITDRVQDLPISRRFFAGGGTSVRGFQLDRLGVPEILNPDGLSRGGNGLVVGNVEVRRVVGTLFGRSVALAGFLDGGNVFPRPSDVALDRLRGAAGFGVRFDSPLGPIRLDFGFKLDRQVVNGGREAGWEYHLSIGEAF